jgi:hypothetical protein
MEVVMMLDPAMYNPASDARRMTLKLAAAGRNGGKRDATIAKTFKATSY